MSDIRGFKRTEGERKSTSDFLIVNPEELETNSSAKKIPDHICKAGSGIYDSFGSVNPILSSGEWSFDEMIEPRGKKQGFLGRIVGLFYA